VVIILCTAVQALVLVQSLQKLTFVIAAWMQIDSVWLELGFDLSDRGNSHQTALVKLSDQRLTAFFLDSLIEFAQGLSLFPHFRLLELLDLEAEELPIVRVKVLYMLIGQLKWVWLLSIDPFVEQNGWVLS
jgi:hypothetical protein